MSHRSAIVVLVSFATLVACGGTVAVGRMDSTAEQLQKTKDGSPTGNGSTCTWVGTALFDEYAAGRTSPTYAVGATFASLDGCNTCRCAAEGIMCTVNACTGGGTCTYGGATYQVGQRFAATDGCNSCSCMANGSVGCTLIGCGDGGISVSDGGSASADAGYACPAIAKQCPDGSYVGPTGPDCTFVCPSTDCGSLSTSASNQVNDVIKANLACTQDSDCEIIDRDSNCFGECTTALAKSGDAAFNDAIANVNANQCAQFKSDGCTFAEPPCVAPGTAHCQNKVCVQTYP